MQTGTQSGTEGGYMFQINKNKRKQRCDDDGINDIDEVDDGADRPLVNGLTGRNHLVAVVIRGCPVGDLLMKQGGCRLVRRLARK